VEGFRHHPERIAEPAATTCAGLTFSNDHHDAETL